MTAILPYNSNMVIIYKKRKCGVEFEYLLEGCGKT